MVFSRCLRPGARGMEVPAVNRGAEIFATLAKREADANAF